MAGETRLTASALAQLRSRTDSIIAASRQTATRLLDEVMGSMMPGFAGDAATASVGVTNAVNQKLRAIHADMEAMAQQVSTTATRHQAHDTSNAGNFRSVASTLNY